MDVCICICVYIYVHRCMYRTRSLRGVRAVVVAEGPVPREAVLLGTRQRLRSLGLAS